MCQSYPPRGTGRILCVHSVFQIVKKICEQTVRPSLATGELEKIPGVCADHCAQIGIVGEHQQ